MADSTLATIRTKVRRLTRSPSNSQLTVADIDAYINTFVLYDFPEHLRLFSFKKTFTFYTEPNIDTYETNTSDSTDPLFNFKNRYITVHEPIYIAGYPVLFLQDRSRFYNLYPIYNTIKTTGKTADDITTNFSGTLKSTPILSNNVLFTSKTAANAGLELHDDGAGVLSGDGTGTIDYISGAFTLAFSTAPGKGNPINSQVVIYQASRPDSILYFDNKFVVRPVPDQVYAVNMEVYARPTELLSTGQSPELEQYWQYIAYGAAKKVFEDRMDLESIAMIEPEYEKQELLVGRRTIVQQASQRTSTIYTDQVDRNGGFGSGWFNN